jgi:hypothetical protein
MVVVSVDPRFAREPPTSRLLFFLGVSARVAKIAVEAGSVHVLVVAR